MTIVEAQAIALPATVVGTHRCRVTVSAAAADDAPPPAILFTKALPSSPLLKWDEAFDMCVCCRLLCLSSRVGASKLPSPTERPSRRTNFSSNGKWCRPNQALVRRTSPLESNDGQFLHALCHGVETTIGRVEVAVSSLVVDSTSDKWLAMASLNSPKPIGLLHALLRPRAKVVVRRARHERLHRARVSPSMGLWSMAVWCRSPRASRRARPKCQRRDRLSSHQTSRSACQRYESYGG